MMQSQHVNGGAVVHGLLNNNNENYNFLPRRGAATLGLGWLIAIILCGGVSLFVCVGFALSWRAQKNRMPLTVTRTRASLPYAATGFTALLSTKASTTRLTKRRMPSVAVSETVLSEEDGKHLSGSEFGWSREFSSRFSLKRIPSVPVLPPLPSYSTFRLFNPRKASYRRERGWLDEESSGSLQALVNGHRQPRYHTTRQRSSSGSGWAGQNPLVLPPVGYRVKGQVGVGYALGQNTHVLQQNQDQPPQPPAHQQNTRLQPNNTDYDNIEHEPERQSRIEEEEPSMPIMPGAVYGGEPGASQGFVRPPAAALARHPSLQDILRSTEMRLRDGSVRSPQKTTAPYDSPSKNSARNTPLRTPRSVRHNNLSSVTPTSHGSGAGRNGRHGMYTGSPTKHGLPGSNSNGDLHQYGGIGAREGSATSIGSAANSLIAEATQELELPGGMGSPSRLRGHEWLAGDDAILQLTAHHNENDDTLQRELAERQYQQLLQQQSPQRSSPQRSPQRQRSERRRSVDSDASSSLSTLYSVGDEMDEISVAAVVDGPDDPFVERSTSQRTTWSNSGRAGGNVPVLQPLRRTMTVSSDALGRHVDRNNMPSVYSPPIQQLQQQHHLPPQWRLGHQMNKSLDGQRFSSTLQPPTIRRARRAEEEVRPKADPQYSGYVNESPEESESSFTDVSVDSTSFSNTSFSSREGSPEEDDRETVMGDNDNDETLRIPAFDTTPTKDHHRTGSDLSSSPFSETDIVSMILAAQSSPAKQKRALPALPTLPTIMAPDGSILPTPLSPPPKSAARSMSVRVAATRKVSDDSSSYYGSEAPLSRMNSTTAAPTTTAHLPLPASRSAHSITNGLSLCNSVAALRRMNSVVSVTSNGSLTSTVVDQYAAPTPALPNLADGRLPQLQSARKGPKMGSKQYLSMGKSSSSSSRGLISGSDARTGCPRSRNGHSRSQTATTVTPERPAKNPRRSMGNVSSLVQRFTQQQREAMQKDLDSGKENAGLGIVRPPSRNEGQVLQESRSLGSTPARDAQPQQQQQQQLPMLKRVKNPVIAELAAAERRKNEKRGSADTLGLYDKDGFLLPSPEREVTKKLLRM